MNLTLPNGGRNWEQLDKDIEYLGPTLAASKHGYKNVQSMETSIRNHNRGQNKAVRGYERKISIAEHVASNVTGEIPADIERQLLSTETLQIIQLTVDHTYQRFVIDSHVRQMAEHWNWLGAGLLTVSLRNSGGVNVYAVIDGQQRLAALKLLGYKEAPCRIYVDLTTTQEAELYELLNKNKKINFDSIFKSRLMRGEEKAKMINMAVEQVNYHLDPEHKHHGPKAKGGHFYIQSMSEMERIYNAGGVTLIMDTLRFVNATWAPDYLGNQQQVIAGVATFLQTYPEANMKELTEKLQKQGIAKTIQNAIQWTAVHGKGTGSNSRGKSFSETMLACYNERRQDANRIKSKVI